MQVADQGCGMDSETRSKIFEPFFTTKFAGRGLGMSAVLGIIRSHHGALHITTKRGEGTTMTVYFPVSSKHMDKQSEPSGEALLHKHTGTILLIDDEESVHATVSGMLKEMGYEVLKAHDGKQGVEVFQQHMNDIDLVLMDMMMPVMDGKACFSALKAIQKDVHVILSSGYSEEDMLQDFPDGLAGFIQKPYTLARLEKVLEEAESKEV
jgi:CheY-like chemotaxis protein